MAAPTVEFIYNGIELTWASIIVGLKKLDMAQRRSQLAATEAALDLLAEITLSIVATSVLGEESGE